MEWWLVLLVIFTSLVLLMLTGMPIAICFMFINIVGVLIFFGGIVGLEQLILSIYSALTSFVILPLPLFILMGELVFHAGIGILVIDTLNQWLGRLPGRLGVLAVGAGTLLSTLTGASISSIAVLGSTLVPEMERYGYKKSMSLGPIMGSGGLAVLIPPSGLAVLLGAIGEISIGKLLVSTIIPALLMAILYIIYIVGRCYFQPSIAPAYKVAPTTISKKLLDTTKYVLPAGLIFFLVVGVIFKGIATPSEAAATGTVGIFILLIFYKRFKWDVIKKSIQGTLKISGMLFLIVAGATTFSQILSFSGATRGLAEFVANLVIPPVGIIIGMQLVGIILGCFMDSISIMMVTLPIFVPTIVSFGFDPVWFGAIFLLNIEIGLITPPFGTALFAMKGVAPPDTTMGNIYTAVFPFIACALIVMALMIAFPSIVLWLPGII